MKISIYMEGIQLNNVTLRNALASNLVFAEVKGTIVGTLNFKKHRLEHISSDGTETKWYRLIKKEDM